MMDTPIKQASMRGPSLTDIGRAADINLAISDALQRINPAELFLANSILDKKLLNSCPTVHNPCHVAIDLDPQFPRDRIISELSKPASITRCRVCVEVTSTGLNT